MHDVVRMPTAKQKELFALTAKQMSMSPGIVEKDFWVVWTLDYLFARSPWRTQLAFKGGTSLSKAYGLIKRFSEDIDLILDWRLLGYGLLEPWETRSNTQQAATSRFSMPSSPSSASSTAATGHITNWRRRRRSRSCRPNMRCRHWSPTIGTCRT